MYQAKTITKLFLAVVAFVGLLAPADAQWSHLKNSSGVRRSFRPIVDGIRKSTVRLFSNRKQVALGLIVDKAGLIVSKSSELEDGITCQLPNYRRYKVKILARNPEQDLALLQLEGDVPESLVPVTWQQSVSPVVGSWLATSDLSQDPIAVGVVSVEPRKIPHQSGFLGVRLEPSDHGPKIKKVLEKSAAKIAELAAGDIITHVNGDPVKRPSDMVLRIRRLRPGEQAVLKIKRGEQEVEVTATLGTRKLSGERASRFNRMNEMGGKLSSRRADFPLAMQHDTVLKPNQCGGPIVDIDGHVIGLNIARAGRTSSLALPSSTVQRVLDSWRKDENLQGYFYGDPEPQDSPTKNSPVATGDQAVK
ncbi:MAG: S1C family serine protease [Planctomycetales bacterium]